MFVCDAHCDTLYALAHGRTPRVTRQALEEGQVALQTFALFAGTTGEEGDMLSRARAMLNCIPRLDVPLFTGDLPREKPCTPAGVLSLEGGELLLGSLDKLEEFARLGVKMIALTWNYENEIGYPAVSGSRKGLKPFGRELLGRMGELGIVADVSHLNDQGIEDVLACSRLPVAASHSNLREVTNVPRNLPRALAKGIMEKGGFIGLNFYSGFLQTDGEATLDDLFAHMEALLELGGEKTLGFGSDFDGIERWPQGLESPGDFPSLIARMEKRGCPREVIEDVAGNNLWNLYQKAQNPGK